MARLYLPHTLDIYAAGTTLPASGGNNGTPLRAGVAGAMELMTADARIRLMAVSKNPLARLWLEESAIGVASDGAQIFWRERASWWTARGTPEIEEVGRARYVMVVAAANAADGFFAP